MKKTEITTLKAIAKTKFLSLYDATYKNRKNEEKHWMIASRKTEEALQEVYFNQGEEKTDAVVIVGLHVETKQIVLVKQMRIPLNDFIYELPAGLIDEGDDVSATIGRELKEETGLTLVNVKKVQDKLYLSAGMTDESVALVYCTCEGVLSTDYLEADETLEPVLLSKEEAEVLLNTDNKVDIKTYLILQQFIHHQLDDLFN